MRGAVAFCPHFLRQQPARLCQAWEGYTSLGVLLDRALEGSPMELTIPQLFDNSPHDILTTAGKSVTVKPTPHQVCSLHSKREHSRKKCLTVPFSTLKVTAAL